MAHGDSPEHRSALPSDDEESAEIAQLVDAPRNTRSGAILLLGTLLANVASYAFFLVLSRALSDSDLGAIGSLINLTTVFAVPALGLQLVGARLVAVAHHEGDDAALGTIDGRMLRFGAEVGAFATVGLAILSPVVANLLHTDRAPVLALAAGLLPMAITFSVQGILQGEQRFGALALVLAVSGLARLAAALVGALVGAGPTAIMGYVSVGWLLTMLLALLFLPRHRRGFGGLRSVEVSRMVLHAVLPTSGLLVLGSLDVLLARHHLSAADSGAYTVGALFEKAALWGMSFLATLYYPRMAQPRERRRAVISALGTTAVIGALGVLIAWAFGTQLARIAGGDAYAWLGPRVWEFTMLGGALAVVQVLVYASLAASRISVGVLIWIGIGAAIALVAQWHGSISQVVTMMLAVVITIAAASVPLVWRQGRAQRRALSAMSAPSAQSDNGAASA